MDYDIVCQNETLDEKRDYIDIGIVMTIKKFDFHFLQNHS